MNSTELTPTKSTALAAYAPLSEASAIVDIYVSSSIANDTLILWDNRFDSKLFEVEILKRNDKYLDLKIASGIREVGNGRELWERTNQAIESGDECYANAVREELIKSSVGIELITGDRWGFSEKLTEIGMLVFPNLEEGLTDLAKVFFSSPKNRDLISRFTIGKAPFEKVSEIASYLAWNEIAKNPCINTDESNSDGPDLQAWDLQRGIRRAFMNAPVDMHWAFILQALIEKLDTKHHYFSGDDFDTELFIKKWTTPNESDPESAEFIKSESGFYTNLPLSLETVAMFVSKFQPKFKVLIKFKNTKEANDSEDILSKAAYFGRVDPTQFAKTFDSSYLNSDSIFFAVFNPWIYKNEKACSELLNYFDGDSAIDYFFKRQLANHEKDTSNRSSTHSSNNDDFDSIISMLGKIGSDHESLKNWIQNFKDELKTAKYWLWLIAGILLVRYFF